MQRRRCKCTQNSFLVSRTLVVHSPAEQSLHDGRAGVLVPGPALLLTLAPIIPEHRIPRPRPQEPRFRWAQVEPRICIIRNDPGSSVEHAGMGPVWRHHTSSTLQPCLLPSRTRCLVTLPGIAEGHAERAEAHCRPGCRRASHGQTPEDSLTFAVGEGPRQGQGRLAGRKKTGPSGCALPSPGPGDERYQGLIGEGVRVVDPLGGTVHVSGLPGAPQRRDHLVIVLTAEQLGLTGVQGDAWRGNREK